LAGDRWQARSARTASPIVCGPSCILSAARAPAATPEAAPLRQAMPALARRARARMASAADQRSVKGAALRRASARLPRPTRPRR
jgi:hypothetical protein